MRNKQLGMRILTGIVSTLMVIVSGMARAQDDAQRTALQQKLKDTFTLTKVTAVGDDIVSAGSILTLHKDGLQMCSLDAKIPLTNVYKNGKLSASKMAWGLATGMVGVQINNVSQRTFVAGEKFFIIRYEVQKDGIALLLYSDPYNNVRYFATLKISIPKGAFPPADEVMNAIAEVVTVDAPESATPATQNVAPQAPPAQEPAQTTSVKPLAPIAPPPPPADVPPSAPPTVAIGQTKDQVVAILGQPQRVAKGTTKEIDYYPDMKVVLVNGKVTDIE
jgi:hypothetical protein